MDIESILASVDWSIPPEELRAVVPKGASLGIALLGCGDIANSAHLPAYRALGLNVVSCFDISNDAAKATADKFGIPNVATSLQEALTTDGVAVADVAFHVAGRQEAIALAAANGVHVLVQKPLAHDLATAEEMVDTAERGGILMQVNQQARWSPPFLLVKKWLERSAIGRLNFMRFEMRGWQEDADRWYWRQQNMTLVDHGIHYFDLLRNFAGRNAVRVGAMHASVPGQRHISPVIYAANIDFGDGLLASHCFNNKVEAKEQWKLAITLDGEEGSIYCDFTKATLSRRDGYELEVEPEGAWYPDGFAGSMANLLNAITEKREPMCSGRDNLETLRLVLGALESAETGKVVQL